jgi:hypothetical protein
MGRPDQPTRSALPGPLPLPGRLGCQAARLGRPLARPPAWADRMPEAAAPRSIRSIGIGIAASHRDREIAIQIDILACTPNRSGCYKKE